MLSNIGSTEIVIIILVLIVLFGGQKIADLAKNLGSTTKELKEVKNEYEKALRGEESEKIMPEQRKKKKKVKEEPINA